MALHARLLHDLAEIQEHPYENIQLIPREDNIRTACLILSPLGQDPLHFTIKFQDDYPLHAPSIRIDSSVSHPNVFGGYICASILNTSAGWTPAYTIKGIAIQLLSFFSSEKLEQDYGGVRDLNQYRLPDGRWMPTGRAFKCSFCSYSRADPLGIPTSYSLDLGLMLRRALGEDISQSDSHQDHYAQTRISAEPSPPIDQPQNESMEVSVSPEAQEYRQIDDMPDEILIRICEQMETEDLMIFARAWNRVGSATGIVTQFNLLRNRELQCFVLKKSFDEAELGVGVNADFRGSQGHFASEFDLLSAEAFKDHRVNKSVQGLYFTHFLPLAISRRHYQRVRAQVKPSLHDLGTAVRLRSTLPSDVIISFMNDVVVKLCDLAKGNPNGSALTRASDRAIESYYHLFHLLLCLATEDDGIVRAINRTLTGVLNGQTSKSTIPNLGHLIIGALISDTPMSDKLLKAIVKEAITRNVVWMLDSRQGKGMAELAYLEADSVSQYRLQKTFEASRTSYTLLMFQNTFRQVINRGNGVQRKSLKQMRDKLFDSHGAPPRGNAARLSSRLRQLQAVSTFPNFISVMGIEMPTASFFTGMLRGCVIDSVNKGYSIWGISQEAALQLRRRTDPSVQVRKDWPQETNRRPPIGPDNVTSFFPNTRGGAGGRGRGRGRGGGRGRGRGF